MPYRHKIDNSLEAASFTFTFFSSSSFFGSRFSLCSSSSSPFSLPLFSLPCPSSGSSSSSSSCSLPAPHFPLVTFLLLLPHSPSRFLLFAVFSVVWRICQLVAGLRLTGLCSLCVC